MKPVLTELVNMILHRLEEYPNLPISEPVMRNWLAGQGFKKRDIDAAIKLVGPRFSEIKALAPRRPGTVRHLTNYEAFKLSPEARHALVRLELYELIMPVEREMLLERLSHIDGEVGIDELDYLIAWIMYGTRDVESQQTIYNVFEGGKLTLH